MLAEDEQHQTLRTRYTAEGELTYDLSARETFVVGLLKASADEVDITDAAESEATPEPRRG
jgi:hypothetical protein